MKDSLLDYNVEFSHIYADEVFGEEQIKSIDLLKDLVDKLKLDKKTFVTCVLVDEFNPVVFKLDDEKVLAKIKEHGVIPDFLAYESKLGEVSDKLLKEIPPAKLKLEYFNKPQKEVLMLNNNDKKFGLKEDYGFAYKHTCALLSASWTLCRLGAYPLPIDALRKGNRGKFAAKKVITILPKKYEEGEKRVLEIIKATKFKDLIKNIEYVFF